MVKQLENEAQQEREVMLKAYNSSINRVLDHFKFLQIQKIVSTMTSKKF